MPKETIIGNPDNKNAVEVRWLKDCDVQLGIRMFPQNDEEIAFIKFFDSHGNEIGAVQGGIGYDSLHVDILTRQQINTLIRVLRRARDQAYGEDA